MEFLAQGKELFVGELDQLSRVRLSDGFFKGRPRAWIRQQALRLVQLLLDANRHLPMREHGLHAEQKALVQFIGVDRKGGLHGRRLAVAHGQFNRSAPECDRRGDQGTISEFESTGNGAGGLARAS